MSHQETANILSNPPSYHTYLLRCWQERSTEGVEAIKVWRFSLEDPRTGQRQGYATLEALLASLQAALMAE
jgi:hypothetical protein